MSEFKFFPDTVVWEITFACNMRCLHCGTSAGVQRPDELTTDEALSLIDELADLGCTTIVLSGGEPLVRPDWIQLAERSKSRGIRTAMITNGYIVTPKVVEEFDRIKMDRIGVSFDGVQKTHDYIRQRDNSWEKALNAMRLMTENGNVGYTAITQVSNINIDEIDDIKQALLDVGCKQWRIQMTTSTGRMAEHNDLVLTLDNYPRLIDKIIEIKKEGKIKIDDAENIGYYGCKGYELSGGQPFWGCYAGMRVAGIESNGDIKGCLSMQEQFVEGNIRDSSFTEIWNNPDGFAYNRQFTRDTATGACHDCRYLPLCRGGCTTTSVSATGERANNPYCIYQMEKKQGIECQDSENILELLRPFEPAMTKKS